jgi:hypothetical protein
MTKVVPQISEAPRSGKAEVKDFYNVHGKTGNREVNVSRIHKRQKSLIERVVTIWDQDQKKTGQEFTGFQKRIIELQNNKDNFDGDPENTKRLLAFLTVFGQNGYPPAEITTLTGGTFNSQNDINNFLIRAYSGESKWKAGLGKISLNRESDPQELALLTRQHLQNEHKLFRGAIIPISNLRILRRLSLQLAMRDRWFGHVQPENFRLSKKSENKQLNFMGGLTPERIAKFDLRTTPAETKALLAFIEAGTSTNLERLITSEASEVSGKTALIEQAKNKGFAGIAEACSQDSLAELRKGGFQRHAETAADINSLDDYRKYIHKDLTSSQASDYETIISVALNDPTSFKDLSTYLNSLGLPITLNPDSSSPEAFLKALDTLTDPQRVALVAGESTGIINQLKDGPWTLKIDAAHTLLLRRLDQISSESEILPVLEKFENLDLSKANPKQLATLIAHGKKLDQLKGQKATETDISTAITTFFKHNEDGTLILDPTTGKPQFKEGKDPLDYKKDVSDREDLSKYKAQAEDQIKTELGDDDPEVLKHYHVLANAQARIDAIDDIKTSGISMSLNNIDAYTKFHLDNYLVNDLPLPSNTHYSTLMTNSKNLALKNTEVKKRVAEAQKELRDQAVQTYKRENISKDKLAELGAVSLAGLKQNPYSKDMIDSADLPQPTQDEVKDISEGTSPDKFSKGNSDKLKAHILANPSSVHGMDLAVLYAIFGSLPPLAQNLSQEQQEQYKSSFI